MASLTEPFDVSGSFAPSAGTAYGQGAAAPANSSAFDATWKTICDVQQDSSSVGADYGLWTRLLALADQQARPRLSPSAVSPSSLLSALLASVESVRQAYDAFLAEFPLVHVYWRKYVEHELRALSAVSHDAELSAAAKARVRSLLERSVDLEQGAAHSVELWTHYVHVARDYLAFSLSEQRDLLQRALACVGLNFAAHSVFDRALEVEAQAQVEAQTAGAGEVEAWARSSALFVRILSTPLEQLNAYWARFQLFTQDCPVEALFADASERSLAAHLSADGDRRAFVLARRHALYEATAAETTARTALEAHALRNANYAPRLPDAATLHAWTAYLRFEEQRGALERIAALYERALIPCAHHAPTWIAYAQHLERAGQAQRAIYVLRRAISRFLRRSSALALELSALQEISGHVDEARTTLTHARTALPTHLELHTRAAALERRHGRAAEAEAILSALEDKLLLESEEAALLWLRLHRAHLRPSRQTYRALAEQMPTHLGAWLACIQYEVRTSTGGAQMLASVRPLVDSALSHVGEREQVLLTEQWLELLHEHSPDASEIRRVQHSLMALRQRPTSAANNSTNSANNSSNAQQSLKRAHDGSGDLHEPASKQARTDE